MNLSEIITKCYILALIIRDDGERLLLGDGIYEFKSNLQHFAPNIYQNDIVELQGTDGQLLAGQVRRSATQAFDGYIADGTIGKTDTEQSRRRFLGFFRKKHHYKVVYIMPDGTAVQRNRGYIVDAPAVQELYQRFPEYHIGLNFEDPNYYEYEEDSEGEEIPANTALISLANLLAGGLVWDNLGAVSQEKTWLDWENGDTVGGFYQYTNGLAGAPLSLTHLYGNATQKTLSGKNLAQINDISQTNQSVNYYKDISMQHRPAFVAGTTYTFSADVTIGGSETSCTISIGAGSTAYLSEIASRNNQQSGRVVMTFTPTSAQLANGANFFLRFPRFSSAKTGIDYSIKNAMLEVGSTATDYEPYCGGVPMPNPDFPSPVNVVSGAQTVRITGKNLLGGFSYNYGASGATVTYNEDGTLSVAGTCTSLSWSSGTAFVYQQGLMVRLSAGTYTFSVIGDKDTQLVSTNLDGAGERAEATINGGNGSRTFTIATDKLVYARIRVPVGATEFTVKFMLEQSATPTSYEPYQGQSYTIDLGSLELCKIGDYTDGIYPSDGKWYKHAEIGKMVLDGTETNWAGEVYGGLWRASRVFSDIAPITASEYFVGMSDYFRKDVRVLSSSSIKEGMFCQYRNTSSVYFAAPSSVQTSAEWKAWLSTHNTAVYYPLATPTDTEITDSELITQLSAVLNTYQGTNNLWLIPSAGAQGELSVHYATGSIDVGAGYEWEEGSGDNSNIVENPGIDRVNPIWKVPGPATNPTLTNITTGQTISWIGSVAAGETLIVDLNRQTAQLGGTNVFSQLSGDWLALAPGANRLEYSATGATEGCTLEWNGVVG